MAPTVANSSQRRRLRRQLRQPQIEMHRATAAAVAAVLAAHAGRGVRGQACVDDPDGTFMKIGTDCAAGLS